MSTQTTCLGWMVKRKFVMIKPSVDCVEVLIEDNVFTFVGTKLALWKNYEACKKLAGDFQSKFKEKQCV